jgi:hypothetical protein
VAILVLRVFSNSARGIAPLLNDAQTSINEMQPGEVKYLYVSERLRESDRRRGRGEYAR